MSMFIEVNSIEKGCKVIINLDTIVEIAPLVTGGCNLFMADSAAVGGKTAMKVSDSYLLFKQFVLETVSEDDIAKRIKHLPKADKEPYPRFISDAEVPPQAPQASVHEIPESVHEEKRGRGRPPKSEMGTTTGSLG